MKRAVVIRKVGDEELADAIANAIENEELKLTQEQLAVVKMHLVMNRIHDDRWLGDKIADANEKYYVRKTPKWLKPLESVWALIIYGFTLFYYRFMYVDDSPRWTGEHSRQKQQLE